MIHWLIKIVEQVVYQRFILMIDDSLTFLLDFLNFLNLLNKREIIFINLRRGFFHFDIWHLLSLLVLYFFAIDWFLFGLGFIADDTSFWPRGHEGPIRIEFLLFLNFFDNDFLFDDGFGGGKVLESVCVLYGKNLSSYKWISSFYLLSEILICAVLILLVSDLSDVLDECKVLFVCHAGK